MSFVNVIDNYADGASGTLTTTSGGTVDYTVSANVSTISRAGTVLGARVTGDGLQTVTVDFAETVHGMTISVNRSNTNEIYFVEIDGVLIDLNDAIADGTVEFSQSGASTHFITDSGGISGTDPLNGSLGFLHFQSPVNSVTVFGTGGGSGNFDLFDIGIDSIDFKIVCFAPDTLIRTPAGQVKIQDLAVGDFVHTLDSGANIIFNIVKRPINPRHRWRAVQTAPIRIQAGALGEGLPTQDLLVSRQHRVMVSSRIAKRITGSTDVLIPAVRLVGLPGITMDVDAIPTAYYHIGFGTHQIVFANNAPVESLYTGRVTTMASVRLIPRTKVAKKIIAAHVRKKRNILEEFNPKD